MPPLRRDARSGSKRPRSAAGCWRCSPISDCGRGGDGGSGNGLLPSAGAPVMSNVPLRRFVIALTSVLFISAVFAAGIGLYVAALARWPLLLVWWPRLVAGVVAVVAVVVPIGAWWLWWRLPRRQVNRLRLTIRDPKARADVEDNFRKTIGQLLAGAAVLIGAALAYLQFTEQQRAAQEQFSKQQQTSHEQLLQQEQASRDLLISNQVSKGFEQLGNDKSVVVRLGGIYALE